MTSPDGTDFPMTSPPPQTLRDLAESERIRLLVDGVTDYAIYMLDPDGYVSSWNLGAQRFKGYLPQQIIGQHFSVFYTDEDRASGLPARALTIARETGRFESEGWRVRRDGTRFWTSVVIDAIRNDQGVLIGYGKITRDITDRKTAQDALRQSEDQFRRLVQGVTDYAIYMLSPEGVVTNWNQGAERIKGYSSTEAIGMHFSRFYAEADRDDGVPGRSLALAAREGRYEQEGWRVRKDGTRFWAHVVVDAIRENGELVGFAKVTRDVTERKLAAEALERANTALFQAQKMEAIGQLTGGIAHDFNNLLSVVSNSLEVLATRLHEHADMRILDAMRRAVDRGATLTQQLLSFARQQPLKVDTHDLNTVIRGFESVLQRAGNSSVRFDLDLAPQLRPVLVDAARFEAALLNLVVNSRDAMPEGGELIVSTTDVDLADHAVGRLPAGPYVQVSVRDTGAGMPPDVAARAFEPFFTTKAVGKGTGLGLSQVYGFFAQSGGDIVLDTRPGQGTTVTAYLPAIAGDTPADTDGNGDSNVETVLLVDDEPDVMDAAAELLRSIGYAVITASNGPDALELLRRRNDIDILFTDVVMPQGMSGIELARLTLDIAPGVKVVLASGYPLPALKNDFDDLDQFAFINKPYRLADLARKLRA
ncbi:hybrid sensor histidine kinase/response regulator [Pigmentiphaga litoralis]|uniref:histidine kinase n=2 Tax=Pigmentiphaga litoralis TaxID=516702 RepID=A0A7Y9IQD4_9BURK|nr:PAS domain-containing sensor histidine kinase [Pigmentiphaga litoralis]NYE25365.1 PAS domain S-box-containing protein [Pigmentiphaga litoralis]NYE81022.1 PAS domain S-box-containing protein [Pigmentiphaga litoralis]